MHSRVVSVEMERKRPEYSIQRGGGRRESRLMIRSLSLEYGWKQGQNVYFTLRLFVLWCNVSLNLRPRINFRSGKHCLFLM